MNDPARIRLDEVGSYLVRHGLKVREQDQCLDFSTGEEKWTGGKVGTTGSCILTSDDRLIVWANRGELMLVETARRSPDEYTELANKPKLFSADAWPHVVLSQGRLYCKDRDGNLKCFTLNAPL